MRETNIQYAAGLPIQFECAGVENYPLHWHDSIQIVLALKGELDIQIGLEKYHIKEGELEMINPNEIHGMKSDGLENRILLVHVQPDFFANYYKGGKDIFFYADSSGADAQKSPRYQTLKRYLGVLLYEYVSKHEHYKDEMEEQLVEMMYHLLNHFHYLFYEEESLREDEGELRRYHRIVQHITQNYMEKVSLKELAEQELLTAQYLSFKIKDTFGKSFNDFLNTTRVEESLKFLLNTDMNISEISEEVGFSHTRYFNKNFNDLYHMTPMEYRKRYQVEPQMLEEMTSVQTCALHEALPFLTQYIENYNRFEYEDRIRQYDIDVNQQATGEFHYEKTINLGNCQDVYSYQRMDKTGESIRALGFTHALIETMDGILQECHSGVDTNWRQLEEMVEYTIGLGLMPILINDRYEKQLAEFSRHLCQHRKDLAKADVHIVSSQEFFANASYTQNDIHERNDQMGRVTQLFEWTVKGKKTVPRWIDPPASMVSRSDTFYGGEGLLTQNGLKKPAYYFYFFLSHMGNQLLHKDDELLITQSEEGFEVLLMGHSAKQDNKQRRRYAINLLNLDSPYTRIRYRLNKHSGSVYDMWTHLGCPAYINNVYKDLLAQASLPKLEFHHTPKQMVDHLFTTIETDGAELVLFKKEE